MIVAGQRYSLRWRYPHRIECVVVEVTDEAVLVDADHICRPYCYLLRENPATLTLSGRRVFERRDFEAMFVRMASDDAIALPTHNR